MLAFIALQHPSPPLISLKRLCEARRRASITSPFVYLYIFSLRSFRLLPSFSSPTFSWHNRMNKQRCFSFLFFIFWTESRCYSSYFFFLMSPGLSRASSLVTISVDGTLCIVLYKPHHSSIHAGFIDVAGFTSITRWWPVLCSSPVPFSWSRKIRLRFVVKILDNSMKPVLVCPILVLMAEIFHPSKEPTTPWSIWCNIGIKVLTSSQAKL